jgi:hypothetical protein
MVVPVLMTSCHVFEKPNSGPDISHATTVKTASEKAQELPVQWVAHHADTERELNELRQMGFPEN